MCLEANGLNSGTGILPEPSPCVPFALSLSTLETELSREDFVMLSATNEAGNDDGAAPPSRTHRVCVQ